MITYKTLQDGALSSDVACYIPVSHGLYQQALEQVEAGEAEILPYVEPEPTPEELRKQAIDAINFAAGEAREKIMLAFVSPGFGTIDEYNNTALEVKKWRDAGSPADDVPAAITAWSTPKQITDEEAAADLEAQESFLRAKLDEVRVLRLAGTVETANAESEWENVAQPHIDALRNYSPQ